MWKMSSAKMRYACALLSFTGSPENVAEVGPNGDRALVAVARPAWNKTLTMKPSGPVSNERLHNYSSVPWEYSTYSALVRKKPPRPNNGSTLVASRFPGPVGEDEC
jgi:hypothetical protein